MAQGKSKRQAMIQAGYSISTANQAKRVMGTIGMRNLVETMQDKIYAVGITPEFMASKLKEWLEATKIVNGVECPDYNSQIASFDRWFEIVKEVEKKKENKPTRRISIEEWINQDS